MPRAQLGRGSISYQDPGLGGVGGRGGGKRERAIKKTRWHLVAETADLLPPRQKHDTHSDGTCSKTTVIQDGESMEARTFLQKRDR